MVAVVLEEDENKDLMAAAAPETEGRRDDEGVIEED